MSPGKSFSMHEPGRRRPAHPALHDETNDSVIVFLTVCSAERKPVFANACAHSVLREAWGLATSWRVGRYVLMPDHIHLFCSPAEFPLRPINQWVAYWKSHAARHWPRQDEAPIWQRDFWDTQLRRSENYTDKWQYVLRNPVRKNLVETIEDWSFQGEMNVLTW
jgi:REP element-mobilizing transposase RayT